jgi:hypothetical protein
MSKFQMHTEYKVLFQVEMSANHSRNYLKFHVYRSPVTDDEIIYDLSYY